MKRRLLGWLWLMVLLLAACSGPGGQTEAGVWDPAS